MLLPPLFSSAGRYQQTDGAEGEPILFNSKTTCLILYFFNCILVGFHLRFIVNRCFKYLSSLLFVIVVLRSLWFLVSPLVCNVD